MKKTSIIAIMFLMVSGTKAQSARENIIKGNASYRAGQFMIAVDAYEKALASSPSDAVAAYNLGTAWFRAGNQAEAERMFGIALTHAKSAGLNADAWYNKGVSLTRQGKLRESIDAYKEALRSNPSDTLARENLIRALRAQQQQKQQEEEDKKKEQESKPAKSKMKQQQVQQLLDALREQERKLQQKIQQSKAPSPVRQEKDW
jgi:tetratricopeptide (TPR) repeat protein